MLEKDPIVVLLLRIHGHLNSLSAGVYELAEEISKRRQAPERNLLSEAQMADYLGISKRALASRRERKTFPAEACEKFGKSWVYSVKAYEGWQEMLWEQVKASKAPARNRSSKPANSRYGESITRLK